MTRNSSALGGGIFSIREVEYLESLPAVDRVRNGRIIAAGCMLPMSGNVNLSRDLGMRHRAGIGISEQTDAVAAIVSEETGSISVAVGGMLKRHLAPETLERLLRNELLAEEERPEGSAAKQLLSTLRGRSRKGAGSDEVH